MGRNTVKRIWLLVAVLAACTDAHGPEHGTQTGNPPVLDRGRVTLEVSADEVHIVGKSGAATPGGASIEVTNGTTGEVITGTAAADGSFDVRVDGSPDDTFVVRAIANEEQSAPVYVVRGGAAFAGEDDGSLACEQYTDLGRAMLAASASAASDDRNCNDASDCRVAVMTAPCAPGCDPVYLSTAGASQFEASIETLSTGLCASAYEEGCSYPLFRCPNIPPPDCIEGQCMRGSGRPSCADLSERAREAIAAAVAAADTRCEGDSDCTTAGTSTVCAPSCLTAAVSTEGKATLEAAVASTNTNLCAGFEASGCEIERACDPIASPPPRCVSGQCTTDVRPGECPTCLAVPLAWGANGGLISGYEYQLAPCANYTVKHSGGEELLCEGNLVACNGVASIGALMNALGHADVQQALAESPITYGRDGRVLDLPLVRIEIGEKIVELGSPCGDETPPSCVPPPPGVEALLDVLVSITEAIHTNDACPDLPN